MLFIYTMGLLATFIDILLAMVMSIGSIFIGRSK